MAGLNILRSNFRFIRNHSLLNLLKVIYISLFLNLSGLYIAYSFQKDLHVLTLERTLLFLALTAGACAGYMLIQNKTMKLRLKEIFVRKWYGGRNKHIFLLLITEQMIVTGFSVLISVATVDFLILFANNTFHILPSISNYGQSLYYHFSMALALSLFIICAAINLRKLSKAKLSDVLVKIS